MRLARATPFEADVPVAAGFRIVDAASEDRATGVSRLYLRHVYEGSADKHSLRNFYREQMPLARWSLVSDGNVKGNIIMRYEKGSESCTILITGQKSFLGTNARVQVIVAREERGNKPPTSRNSP